MWVYLCNPINNPLYVPRFLTYKDSHYRVVMHMSVHQKPYSVAVEYCTRGCLTRCLVLISKACDAVGLDSWKTGGAVSQN